jgi:hypothetical protein
MRSTETVMEMNSRYARAFIRLFPRIRIFKMAIPASKSADINVVDEFKQS